jgi:two-component system response regulator YesN
MPFMDGLALSRLIRNELPWTKIIILSGYDEFQYAKEAINIGVTDYLLKPIGSSKVLETLLKIRDNIEEERNLREMQIRYRKEMQENENYQRRQFFTQLISDSSSVPEILNRANELDIDLAAKSYNILLFICSQKDKNLHGKKYSGKLVQMEEKIEKIFRCENI